ncbi:MAG: hypothetical protein ABWW69_04540 [Pyrodictiaceae archaeon]
MALVAIDPSKYPFVVSIEDFLYSRYGVKNLAIVIARRREILDHAVTRLEHALRIGRLEPVITNSVEVEVISFYTALVIARMISRWLVSRLALAEAERASQLLERDEPAVVEAVARRVGLSTLHYHAHDPLKDPIAVRGSLVLYNVFDYSIDFREYVRVARRLIGDPAWRPTNLPVLRGRVYLDKKRAIRIVKEAITSYIEGLDLERSVVNGLEELEPIKEALNKLSKLMEKYRFSRTKGSPLDSVVQQGVVIEAFPPCMADIFERAKKGEHLSHHERFAIATFMLSIGADIDEVVDVFRAMPDFNERITRYQVEHLAGLRGSMKKYRTYSCETMHTLGLCKAECGTRSPIQAYYRRLRKLVGRTQIAQEGSKDTSDKV